ncbi:hypothetical protein AVEN_76872-1 [Araneus ventricosus]|uniref:Uncharacterized protein n=1 Tax=Araneus ventricosus TaxID=182803 RepID=A0A4Y2CZV0_ARAVE|nr:hypothetical protein AVEN_76872-1 [Araneus ventricosus]
MDTDTEFTTPDIKCGATVYVHRNVWDFLWTPYPTLRRMELSNKMHTVQSCIEGSNKNFRSLFAATAFTTYFAIKVWNNKDISTAPFALEMPFRFVLRAMS